MIELMKILLLGASGFLGGALWSALSQQHEIVGTYSGHPLPGLVHLDLRDGAALADLAGGRFDLVIHTAGLVDVAPAEADPDLAWAMNVKPLDILIPVLARTGARLLFVSTDYVFDGARHVNTEHDERAPVNVYGRTKAAAEDLVLQDSRHLVLRLPLLFGRSPWSDKFMARLAGSTTPAQVDIVCAPIYVPSLAATIDRLWDMSGVVHYGGREVVSRYELMSRVQAALELPTRVVPVREADAGAPYRRPPHVVLRSLRHSLLGPDVDDALRHMSGAVRAVPLQ